MASLLPVEAGSRDLGNIGTRLLLMMNYSGSFGRVPEILTMAKELIQLEIITEITEELKTSRLLSKCFTSCCFNLHIFNTMWVFLFFL
jgi:hypothetical protein